jgi:hypothetical protein
MRAGEGQVIRFRLLLCTIMLACGVTSASATMRIVEDHGGQVGKYLDAFAKVRSTGEHVIIDGNCFSACTGTRASPAQSNLQDIPCPFRFPRRLDAK